MWSIKWLRENSFLVHTVSFIVMTVCAGLMAPAARFGWIEMIWILISLFALANLAILGTKP